MKLSVELAKVTDWGDLEWHDWLQIAFWILLGGLMLTFSVVMPFQTWIVEVVGLYWLKSPAVISIFWIGYWAIAHNTLTTTFAMIEKWYLGAATIAIVLIVSAFVGLGGLAKEIWTVIVQHGGSNGWTLLIGIVIFAVVVVYYLVRGKK